MLTSINFINLPRLPLQVHKAFEADRATPTETQWQEEPARRFPLGECHEEVAFLIHLQARK